MLSVYFGASTMGVFNERAGCRILSPVRYPEYFDTRRLARLVMRTRRPNQPRTELAYHLGVFSSSLSGATSRRARCPARRDDRSHPTPAGGGGPSAHTSMQVSRTRSDSVWHAARPTRPRAALTLAGRTPRGPPLVRRRLAGWPAARALA